MNISSSFFKNNRQALRHKLDLQQDDFVLIAGSVAMQFHSDQAGEFLQESNFFYLTGITSPNCTLILNGERELLLIPDQDDFEQQWNGQLSTEDARRLSDIDTIYGYTEGWKELKSRLKKAKKVHMLKQLPEFIYGNIFTNPATRILNQKLSDLFTKIKPIDVNHALAELRVIKQQPEIDSIQMAIDITSKSLDKVFSQSANTQSESDIDATIAHDFIASGYREAYRSIVAGGKNSCTIHYVNNNQPISNGDMLLIDAGARVNGYAADITRTSVVGKASKRQLDVINAVAEVHAFALDLIKPGVKFIDYEHMVADEMGKKLKQLKLIHDSNDEDQVRKYFPHATSHFLGLDVHDVGARAGIEFQENMILTVEPGIYIPEESVGVRLEDDILITSTGNKNLSQKLPLFW